MAVTTTISREQHKLRPVLQLYFRANDERQAGIFRRDMCAYDARE